MSYRKTILLLLIVSILILSASASTIITVNVKRIQLADEIEGSVEGEADWYYYVGLSDDNENIVWKSSPTYHNDDITLSDTFSFTTTSTQPYILIMLCEEDDLSNDDLADISSLSSGTSSDFDNFASFISPSTTQRYFGTFKSQYSLKNNQFILGDTIEIVNSQYKTSGDFDNKVGDENDANLWFIISDNYNLPTVDAGIAKHYKVGELVNFNGVGTASAGSTIDRYQWDFNNDGTFDAEGQTTSYTYSKAGTYNAKLKVTDNFGEVATDTVQVTISTVPPIAGFTFSPTSPYTSDTITFTDTSIDQDGTIASWSWNFGDGKTSIIKNPTYKFSDNGKYNVKLTVTDNDGASSEKTLSITVKNIAPTADFSFSPSNPYINNDVNFNDASKDPDGTIASWSWNFGDGYTSTNKNPTHKFENNKEYYIKLTVTDNDGSSDDLTKSISIIKPTSTASPTSNPTNSPKSKATTTAKTSDVNSSNSIPGFGIIFGIIGIFIMVLFEKKFKI